MSPDRLPDGAGFFRELAGDRVEPKNGVASGRHLAQSECRNAIITVHDVGVPRRRGSKYLFLDIHAEYHLWKYLSLYANLRNVTDAPEQFEISGPSTPEYAQFRSRIAYGSLWTFGIRGAF
jgi:hypothetical protein